MAATNQKPSEAADAPWYAAYPAPKSEAATISREEVLAMLKAAPLGSRDFVLVDLRRNDFEVSPSAPTLLSSSMVDTWQKE